MMPTVVPKGHTFLDMDRLFGLKTGILTLIGSVLILVFGLLPVLYLPLDGTFGVAMIPYRPTLVLLFVVLFSAITGNLSSSMIIGLIGGISIVSPDGQSVSVYYPQGYLLLMVVAALIAGYLGNAAFSGKSLNITITVIFVITMFFIVLLSLGFNNHVDKYNAEGILVGHGGPMFGVAFPLIEILLLVLGLLFAILAGYFLGIRSLTLTRSDAKKMNIIGLSLIVLGSIIGIVFSIIFVKSFNQATMSKISPGNNSLVIRDHFFHVSDKYGVVITPMNAFVILTIVYGIILLGTMFRVLALAGGNLRNVKIGSISAYVALPASFTVYTIVFLPEFSKLLGYASHFSISYELSVVYVSAWIGITGITSLLILVLEALIAWIIKVIE